MNERSTCTQVLHSKRESTFCGNVEEAPDENRPTLNVVKLS